MNKPARRNLCGDGVELGGVQSMSEQLLNMETITSDSLLTWRNTVLKLKTVATGLSYTEYIISTCSLAV